MDNNYFGITDVGKVRGNNEDTFVAKKITGNELVLACVIDGVGGYAGGEVAAAIAKETIKAQLDQPTGDILQLMRKAITEANDRILSAKQQEKAHEDMACVLTIAIADLSNNLFYYAHVGDTRLYLLRDNSLIKISKDQSFVGFMEDSGRLTEEQAMLHPKRNEINKALGFPGSINGLEEDIETGQSPFLPGDLILLCSDGLSDMVNKKSITSILLKDVNLEQKGKALIDLANANGGRDNITVVLVKNDKATFVHEATKPKSEARKKKTVTAVLDSEKTNPAQQIPVQTNLESTVSEKTIPENRENLTQSPDKRQGSKLNPALLILGFVVIAAIAYFFWDQQHPETKPALLPDSTVVEPSQAFKLQDTLNKLKGNILILDTTLFKSPILITEPIKITRDSLYLKAERNLVIKSDTGYKGPAFLISPSNKSILLENFTLENVIDNSALQKKGVLLKNVNFIRTDIPAVKPK
ncbi:protein phosphatase 2C domain-containing protein [Pedobacter gandavensis]|uniref:PP2C family protein-serine/threonine phosphatase n=1 Tax=Pedobacter gandavensis TaxID=2679963 RepID=UPI00247ADDBF|nr:protein phosphatase 2C domain-containing protein [Pedobacter gandavensis]WGQ11391.1 protein phosphatase 2C domain-containing protein [Pedobacter gandavensis]